jgi:uncharacterized membrane protein HdeD (DUF308 family)
LIQTLVKNWWLLALCGVLEAAISAVYLVMQRTHGPVLSNSWSGTVVLVGKVALVAGVCTIAAAIWKSTNGKSWGLAVNGVALTVLGFVQFSLTRFPISILAFSVLIIVMAVSIGTVELIVARHLLRQHQAADGWFFGLVGIASISLVLPSLALGLRWIPTDRGSQWDLLWLALYFGLAAIGMIALAVRLHPASTQCSRLAP